LKDLLESLKLGLLVDLPVKAALLAWEKEEEEGRRESFLPWKLKVDDEGKKTARRRER